MDLNKNSNAAGWREQPSIKSFFQPRTPRYSAPASPASSRTSPTASTLPRLTFLPVVSTQFPSNPTSNLSKTTPQQAIISSIEQNHIQPLRRINSLLLPISYPESFYHNILTNNLSRVILWTDPAPKVIGGIVCRLDPSLSPSSTSPSPQYLEEIYDIYIQSLALLSPYREKGLAAEALESIIAAAVAEKEVRIRDLYAHVWTNNLEALKWYAARGFKKEENVIQGYYRRLEPDTAWILRRRIAPSDHLAHTPKVEAAPASMKTEDNVRDVKIRAGNMVHTKSFQDRRPDMEWNDLPEDVINGGHIKLPSISSSAAVSLSSSRSSSRTGLDTKGKKKRQYPAAAFGT